jgi:hypothetical protein
VAATPFAVILKRVVEATPHAIGGAFAAWDGEMVDSFARRDPYEWAVLTAHYGVVLANLYAAFGTLHFGSPEVFLARHKSIDVLVCAVDKSYYTLLAIDRPAGAPTDADPFADAIVALGAAAAEIRKDIA